MKAYVAPIPVSLSKSIHRLADALTRYAPADVEIVTGDRGYLDADFLLCHMIGQEGWQPHLDAFRSPKRYAIWQHCLISTRHPDALQWADLWLEAAVVASCYDLATPWRIAAAAAERYLVPNFARIPLGVDTDVFTPQPLFNRTNLVATSGYVAGTECVGEWGRVCDAQRAFQFHLGPPLPELARFSLQRNNITDAYLAEYYSTCRFVSGLRRSEGFELPAYEGLACGARPVMFARADAYDYLGDHAEYIAEGSYEQVVAQLEAVVRRDYRPVTAEEIAWVGREFSWQRTAERFWSAIPR